MRNGLFAVFSIALALAASPVLAVEAQLKTQAWSNNAQGFAQMQQRIDANNSRNLLARPGVRIYGDAPSPRELADGTAGVAGGDGRVNIEGQPSVIAIYLGQPKPIHEVGVFTYNGDSRANQDFEVRFADNSASPGKMPKFDSGPVFSTGDKILGNDGGGFHTSFAARDGGAILPAKADWVEFRVWRTYPVKAGLPAKTKTPQGWTAVVELEVLGEPGDVVVLTAEQKAKAAALRDRGDRPPYVKMATWQETMLASREMLLQWECEIDQLMLERAGVTLGPWRALEPLPANSDELRQVERLGKVDLSQPLALKGRQLTWRDAAVKDGAMADLAKLLGAKPGQVIVLCRPLTMEMEFGGDGLAMGVGTTGGRLRMIGGQSSVTITNDGSPALPNQRSWNLREKPGQYHLLAMLPVGQDGQCRLWLMAQPPTQRPGAGNRGQRIDNRKRLYDQIRRDFKDDVSLAQLKWEELDSIWVRFERRQMSGREQFPTDWVPGAPNIIADQYKTFAEIRIAAAEKRLETIEPAIRERVEPWLKQFKASPEPTTLESARARYYAIAAVQDAMAEHHRIESMRLAVKDQQQTFSDRYPRAAEYLKRIDALDSLMRAAWPKITASAAEALPSVLAVRAKVDAESQAILLDNPVLAFEKLLLGKGGPGFSSNWGGANNIGSELAILSPVRPDGKITTIHKGGGISDMDLSFDARKILFGDRHAIHEVNVDGTGYRQITKPADQHTKHYDPCRLPNGKIAFISTACEQAVPCTGEWYVGNLHLMDDDGSNERRLTYDQDHNWNPSVLNNGQIVYTRWEYTDTPHYFTRLLFSMNPDGSNQAELYGSGSYWPNSMYWTKPIPGHPSQVVCIVSGHHGVSRVGEMVVLDPAQSRHEADGVVCRIGDRGRKVEPIIEDGLVSEVWPRFAWPYPLAEPGTNRGAGKYFLAVVKMDESSPWGIYLVDTFDNMTPILMGSYAQPIPLLPRPTPPVLPTRVDPTRKDATVYMANVYTGGGLRGYPAGSVKSLRIGSHVYRYGDNGDTYAATYEGGWDVKRILGTVPVEPDGSALFKVPANTPVFVQPLDADGKSLQVMRSWFSAMPGETLSCIGCHDKQNDAPPAYQSQALSRGPSDIHPWNGPVRGFGFEREVQPVLDRRCAGCHDGQAHKGGAKMPDFRSKQLLPDYKGTYSPAYLALTPYVRRAGYEADYHLPAPAEWHASTSPLIQMLEKGHHNVQLTRDERDRLHTWIDFNVPYAGNWRESHRPPQDEQVERRTKYMKLFANVDDRTEEPLPLPPVAAFEKPAPEQPKPAPMKLDGWPLSAEQAKNLQGRLGMRAMTLDLGNGVSMALAPIPAGRFVMGDAGGFADENPQSAVSIARPFYMGTMEVTNRQYAMFNPSHDSAYIDARGKDRFTRGYPANEPDQPVVRITWHEAMAFCRWLSEKTGHQITLPTEAQWEWACRAGSDTAWNFGDAFAGNRDLANIADSGLSGWGWGRVDRDYSDSARFSVAGGKYPANAWGLHDMHGNVAEWTLSDHRAYPYAERNEGGAKVIRGGSWNDTFRFSRSASRWRYLPHQPVYNVGFRVVCMPATVNAER